MTELNGTEYRDLVITGLVVLALAVAVLWWVADTMGKQDAAKRYIDHDEDFRVVPSAAHQAKVAADHCAKVAAKRDNLGEKP